MLLEVLIIFDVQYKSLFPFLWRGGGIEVSLRTACCCQKQSILKFFKKDSKTFRSDLYAAKKDPNSQAGTQMGLIVMLDAHTDMLTEFSVTDDFDGFTTIVTTPSDFPLMYQQGFGIKAGK